MQADPSQEKTPAPPAEPSKAERDDTIYVILQEDKAAGNPDGWALASEDTRARTAEAAVRAYVEGMKADKLDVAGITCVAIPARSWKPMRIRPKVETTLVIEDA